MFKQKRRGYTTGTYVDGFAEGDSLVHGISTIVQSVAPVMEKESEAQLTRRVLFQCVADSNEILQRLGHLATADR